MHYNRSSSSSPSFLPSLCSLQTFIGLAVILCVYFTLESSISLHEKSLPSQQIKNVAFHTSVLSAPKIEFEEPQSVVDQPPSFSYVSKEESDEETKEETLPAPLLYTPNNEANLTPSPADNNAQEEIIGGLAEDFEITWGDGRGKFHDNGSLLTLSLDKYSGSGFQSKNEYLFAKIEVQIKLIPDNSAGTVTTFYLSSNGSAHDEIDFEFLGNLTGMPYTIHTNVYCEGKGNREQQFYLWFDPTADFHTYSILWTPLRIVFFVDGIPIREFKNMEAMGVPFPRRQPMRIYSSLWNADDWATQGGRVHTDWSKAPFVASYRNFNAEACVWSSGSSSCGSDPRPSGSENAWLMEKLEAKSLEKMRWVQENYMTYDYCQDTWRFHDGLPKECNFRKSARSKLGQPPI